MKVNVVGNRYFTINSYVDAQNSFSAMLRTRFTCVLERNEAAKIWTAQDFKNFTVKERLKCIK